MSFQCSVGSVIRYLKCITKEDQGRFVVVTDKKYTIWFSLSGLSYLHKILSLEVFTMVMPFTAMQSDCVVGVLLMWSCGGLKALYKWQITAFAPVRSFFCQWRCVTTSNSSAFLERSSNFHETLFARKYSLTSLFFSANMSNVVSQKK